MKIKIEELPARMQGPLYFTLVKLPLRALINVSVIPAMPSSCDRDVALRQGSFRHRFHVLSTNLTAMMEAVECLKI